VHPHARGDGLAAGLARLGVIPRRLPLRRGETSLGERQEHVVFEAAVHAWRRVARVLQPAGQEGVSQPTHVLTAAFSFHASSKPTYTAPLTGTDAPGFTTTPRLSSGRASN